ncbi:hypothetical protein FQN50_006123 [Emmonsiellopsis sp. PD_5]|nr:hypothetical protein FQN50_006123 [Emmonsiellopsis sp. PD_5]
MLFFMSPDQAPAGPSVSRPGDNADESPAGSVGHARPKKVTWKKFLGIEKGGEDASDPDYEPPKRERWSMGILNDKETEEVPGTVLLLASNRNEPLGLRQQPERTSTSSFPSPYPRSRSSSRTPAPQPKRTSDGEIVLDPQPDDSLNDPLNWPAWRRDLSLLSLGFYSMIGGGMTPILAAGYHDVSASYGITSQQVALTTGLYMLGLGLGSVIMSPTAILIVAITIGFGLVLVFLFVPESFWDRTPRPRAKRPKYRRSISDLVRSGRGRLSHPVTPTVEKDQGAMLSPEALATRKDMHVGFAPDTMEEKDANTDGDTKPEGGVQEDGKPSVDGPISEQPQQGAGSSAPSAHTHDDSNPQRDMADIEAARVHASLHQSRDTSAAPSVSSLPPIHPYISNLQASPPRGFVGSLQLWNGRLSRDSWFRVMVRPFILFAYPAVWWSALVYALSVGWLIVLSEAVAEIYRDKHSYNFSALATGLVYISPFVGGILGTVVAGKVSDIIVRFMSRRNGGVYEPEFRLVMAIPIALTTAMGLMGFGWSAQEKDRWIIPTVFFGILSFGCSVGSTTAITFCVDSYRQYAGEALVTLNFSKNVLHGFVFSLFFVDWLKSDGARNVFIALGGIHLACMLTTIPLYIYGKRMRMWTVRKRLMEKF